MELYKLLDCHELVNNKKEIKVTMKVRHLKISDIILKGYLNPVGIKENDYTLVVLISLLLRLWGLGCVHLFFMCSLCVQCHK